MLPEQVIWLPFQTSSPG